MIYKNSSNFSNNFSVLITFNFTVVSVIVVVSFIYIFNFHIYIFTTIYLPFLIVVYNSFIVANQEFAFSSQY